MAAVIAVKVDVNVLRKQFLYDVLSITEHKPLKQIRYSVLVDCKQLLFCGL